MDLTTIWFWIGTAGMALGTLLPARLLVTDGRNRKYYAVLALITAIATVAYATMALDIGRVSVNGTALYLPRYIDWLLTTPLLVLYLGLLCKPSRRVYAGLLVTDIAIIGFGVAAGVSDEPLNYALWGGGVVAYLGLLYLLVVTLPRQASLYSDRVTAVFTKLRNLTVVLWTIYPAVWILGPLGLGVLNGGDEVVVVAYLDLISKVGFVVMAVNGRDAFDHLRSGAPLARTGGSAAEGAGSDAPTAD